MVALTVFTALALAIALLFAGIWGLFHAKRVLEQRGAALRDAFWMTLVLFCLFRSAFELAAPSTLFWATTIISSVLAPLTSGALCLLAFPALFLLNLHLVALAAMTGRGDRQQERVFLSVFWPHFLVCLGIDYLLRDQRPWPSGLACLSAPFFVLALLHLLRRRGVALDALLPRLITHLHRKCTFRWGKRQWDLRGVVLGSLTGALVLLTTSPILGPYQRAAYISAIQMGSNLQTVTSLLDQVTDGTFKPILKIEARQETRPLYEDLVVVRYDATTRHRASEPSLPEARIQAQLLEKLAPTQPKAILLPLPPEREDQIPSSPNLIEEALTDRGAQHNPEHYATLAKAIQSSANVYLYSTPYRRPPPSLAKVAKAHGTSAVTGFGPAHIPAGLLPRTAADTPSVALLLSPLAKRPAAPLFLIDYRTDLHEIRAPVLVAQVLRGEPLYDAPRKQWVKPEAFFKGKTVFIEAASPRYFATPLGLRTEAEVLAQTTATLRAGAPLQPLPLWLELAVVLSLSALVGHLSVGRAPLEALWRTSLPILVVVGAVFGLTAFSAYCSDPILPLVGALLAFFVVTQFTFALERGERDRNHSVLRRFLPPQIIDQMVDDPEGKLGLGGKRRPIVVLFADVRGFSGFAERRTPEEVVATMNRYLAEMTDALNDHEGILDKYTGDGLMALFPVEDEPQDVARAVQAALAMAQAVQRVARTLQAEGGDELAVGIGLHYGDAVVGLVGHPTRQVNYTALGHTVVVAARLQTLALGGEVILSEAVFQALPPGTVAGEAGEAVSVKGVAKPIPIYRLRVENPPNR